MDQKKITEFQVEITDLLTRDACSPVDNNLKMFFIQIIYKLVHRTLHSSQGVYGSTYKIL